MKKIVCEMCEGTKFLKEGDFYICQGCGTKFSSEDAKKMMVEIADNDDSISTVRVDQSDELTNLYEVARRARNDNNSEKAAKYYDELVVKDPNSWEAAFYSVYYQSMNCKIAGIRSAAFQVSNCEESVLNLIKTHVKGKEAQEKAVKEVVDRCIEISSLLYNAANNHFNSISSDIRYRYIQELVDRLAASVDISYLLGDRIKSILGEDFCLKYAVPSWEHGIDLHRRYVFRMSNKEQNKQIIMSYAEKIKEYKQDYEVPEINEKSGGCYVATCVYGSYDCPQVWTLRRYRDNTLASTWYGRAFIHTYYAVSPTIVKLFGDTKWFRKMWRGRLDRMVADLQAKGFESTPYNDKKW